MGRARRDTFPGRSSLVQDSFMAIGTTLQNIMRKDAGVDGDAPRISRLVWMICLEVFDDHEAQKELLEDHYKRPIPEPTPYPLQKQRRSHGGARGARSAAREQRADDGDEATSERATVRGCVRD